MHTALVGTSGFTLQNFYPLDVTSKQRLEYYSKKFPTVEINSCFYHLPTIKTLESWRDAVPADFVFSFKVWNEVTHSEGKLFNEEALAQWLDRLTFFGSGDHICLFQFPKSSAYSFADLKRLVSLLSPDFKYAFEFRHPDWFNQDVYTLLKESKTAIVLSDSPVSANNTRAWPLEDVKSNEFIYIRFHGSDKLYFSSYSDSQLNEYAELIKQKITGHKTIYCYFNNDARGHAAANAIRLIELLDK